MDTVAPPLAGIILIVAGPAAVDGLDTALQFLVRQILFFVIFLRRLSENLGCAYYDQEIVKEIAKRTELSVK